jgi:hypothetical protein
MSLHHSHKAQNIYENSLEQEYITHDTRTTKYAITAVALLV